MLFTRKDRGYDIHASEIRIWGTMEIFNSPAEATESLEAEDIVGSGIRLIRVADHDELKAMLQRGKEVLQGGANLYVRVARTCPAF